MVSLSIDEAIEHNSYHKMLGVKDRVLEMGDISLIDKADIVIEG